MMHSGRCHTFEAGLARYSILIGLALSFASPALAASITGIGDLAGGEFLSEALGVSADGSTVVGRGTGEFGREAIRWSATLGLQGLGHLPGGGLQGSGLAVSADGSVIVGTSDSTASASEPNYGTEAFRWDATNGMQGLGDLPGGGFASVARAVSADGAVVAGFSVMSDQPGDAGAGAFRWDAMNGIQGLGPFPGGPASTVGTGISADASIIVGGGGFPGDEETFGFRWDAADGYRVVGNSPPGLASFNARAISADGSVITGRGFGVGYRWDAVNGVQPLGPDVIGGFAIPNAISGDGSVIVGDSVLPGASGAFIWTEDDGLQDLEVYMTALGLDLAGWQLFGAAGVSADGNTIVGSGLNPAGRAEGFVVVVPEPSTSILLGLGLATLSRRRSRAAGSSIGAPSNCDE